MELEKENLELAENVVKEAVKEIKEERSFAMELILNARNDAKRWFIVAMTILFMWLATIAGFVWYVSQYDYISYQQDGEGYNNINTDVQGSVYNNNGTEGQNSQEENQK